MKVIFQSINKEKKTECKKLHSVFFVPYFSMVRKFSGKGIITPLLCFLSYLNKKNIVSDCFVVWFNVFWLTMVREGI